MHFDYAQYRQRGFSLISIIIAVILILVLGGIAYQVTSKQNQKVKENLISALQQSQSTDKPTVDSPTPTGNIPADCNDQGNDFFQRSDFRKGEILVGFNKDVALTEAQKVIQDYSLEIKDTDSFNYLQLLSVKVPQGEESKWICTLQKNHLVKYAELNTIIKIPDCSKDPC